jgi:dTDP-glucose 4,6-dehydratase
MKVLVTGAAGFIGHHVTEFLLEHTDWDLVLIDRLDISGNLNRLAEIGAAKNPRVRFFYHDLRAPFNELMIKQIGHVDYFVHMAAGSHVDRSIEAPMEFVMDNVVATCNLLELARKGECQKFMYFGTDEVFGPAPPGVRFKEYDRYNSSSPYSATKAGAEELCVAYANTYKLPVQIVHVMNVLGYRQHPEKFLPMLISKIECGEIINIHGTACGGESGTRFYIDARDVADAVLMLLKSESYGKFNVVGERETGNLDLACWVAKEMDMSFKYVIVDAQKARPGHDLRYAMDGGLLLERFGWQPKVPIQQRVSEIVQWTLSNRQWLL